MELPEVAVPAEEEALKGTIQELKDELEQACKRNWLEEIRKLTRRLDELKNGKGTKIVIKTQKRTRAESRGHPEEQPRMKIPEEVFPEEVWRMIFGYVSDPKDLWNLRNTCQLFDNIIPKWKTGWLLEQALPHLYQHLPGKKLLECRMVCRSWNTAIDDLLGNHASARPHDPDRIDPRRLDFVNPVKEKLMKEDLLSPYDFMEYLWKPEPKRPAPFIGRFADMYLESGPDEDYEGLLDDARKYLNRFGKDLWYLVIILPGPTGIILEEPIHSNVVQLITVDLFRLVPNLRRLDMFYVEVADVGFINPGEIDLGSIPDAPQLDTILGHVINHHEDAILEALLNRFHSQLLKLCLTVHTWHRVRHLNLSNLTDLHLVGFVDLENLMNLSGVQMPRLSKLSAWTLADWSMPGLRLTTCWNPFTNFVRPRL